MSNTSYQSIFFITDQKSFIGLCLNKFFIYTDYHIKHKPIIHYPIARKYATKQSLTFKINNKNLDYYKLIQKSFFLDYI